MSQGQIADNPLTADRNRKKCIGSLSFWATVLFLALVTLGLTLVGRSHILNVSHSRPVELPRTLLERLLSETAITAIELVEPDIESLLDTLYGPAYEAVPEYAAFHYSVLGQYVELTAAVRRQMSQGIEDRLFRGFEERLVETASVLDQRYVDAYRSALQDQIAQQLTVDGISLPLGEISDEIVEDAVARAYTTGDLRLRAHRLLRVVAELHRRPPVRRDSLAHQRERRQRVALHQPAEVVRQQRAPAEADPDPARERACSARSRPRRARRRRSPASRGGPRRGISTRRWRSPPPAPGRRNRCGCRPLPSASRARFRGSRCVP
jgi:hypothetical protein